MTATSAEHQCSVLREVWKYDYTFNGHGLWDLLLEVPQILFIEYLLICVMLKSQNLLWNTAFTHFPLNYSFYPFWMDKWVTVHTAAPDKLNYTSSFIPVINLCKSWNNVSSELASMSVISNRQKKTEVLLQTLISYAWIYTLVAFFKARISTLLNYSLWSLFTKQQKMKDGLCSVCDTEEENRYAVG